MSNQSKMEPKQHTPDDVIIKIDDVKKWIYALLGVGCILIGVIWNWMREENRERKAEIKAVADDNAKQDNILTGLSLTMETVKKGLEEARASALLQQQGQNTILLQLSEARLTLSTVAEKTAGTQLRVEGLVDYMRKHLNDKPDMLNNVDINKLRGYERAQ